MYRLRTLPNGRRILQVHRGAGPPEAETSWITAELDAEGNPYLYRAGGEVTVGVSHAGLVLLGIAGVLFSVPDEQLQDLAGLLPTVLKEARKRRKEFEQEVLRAASPPA